MEYRPPSNNSNKINHNAPAESITRKSFNLIFTFFFLLIIFFFLLNLCIRGVIYFAPIDFAAKYRDQYIDGLIAEKDAVAKARQDKIETIFEKLMKGLDEDVSLRVYVAEKKGFTNAVATPTGLVIIGKGLLDYLETDQQIAMILGHEIGHQINRDTVAGLANALTLSIVFTMFSGENFASDIVYNLSHFLSLKFSRDAEYAADSFGLKLLKKTYGSSDGAIEAYKGLIKALKDEGVKDSNFDLFATHPGTEKRIKLLKKQLSS